MVAHNARQICDNHACPKVFHRACLLHLPVYARPKPKPKQGEAEEEEWQWVCPSCRVDWGLDEP
jgi:hypothetical protein